MRTYRSALLILVLSTASCGSRPDQTELSLSDYLAKCDGRYYEERCQGKFVLWDGTIETVPEKGDYLRIRLGDGEAIDLQGVKPDLDQDVEGRRIRFSGYLGDENFIYPDVNSGRVEQYLNSATAAEAESRSPTTTPEEDEAIKAYVNGCTEGWRDEYLTYEDCVAGKKFGS